MQPVSDYLFKSFITSNFAKEKINIFFITIITTIIRSIITSIITTIFYRNIFFIDFTVGIIVPCILALNTSKIYKFVNKFSDETMTLSKYVIKNYSEENVRIWRRTIVLSVSGYYIIYLWIYEIKSVDIIFSILQFILCYFIVDLIETKDSVFYKSCSKIYEKIFTRSIILEKDFTIIEEYVPKTDLVKIVGKKDILKDTDFIIFDEK